MAQNIISCLPEGYIKLFKHDIVTVLSQTEQFGQTAKELGNMGVEMSCLYGFVEI